MKNFGIVALSGAALLQVASAACCRSNKCLKAVVLAGDDGLADCLANLVVTVTPSAVTLTETLTVVGSAVETALFTETSTETASTEKVLLTETTTITAATQTDIIFETAIVPVTTTVVESANAVTTTSYVYQQWVKARQVESTLPDYVTAHCEDWDKYVKACNCAGVAPTTVAASAATEIVKVTAGDAITTTVATLSSTQTDIVTVTETTSSTVTDTLSLTDTTTVTSAVTASGTTTVLATSTPTTVVSFSCKPRDTVFRASTPFPDGSTRWMNSVSNTIVAWQSFAPGTSEPGLYSSTWTMDGNGHLEHKNVLPGQTQVFAMYMDKTRTAPTAQVLVRPRSEVESGVADGRWIRIKGCVDAATNELRMTGNERPNILSCGNGLYLSTGNGSDVRSDCLMLYPTAS